MSGNIALIDSFSKCLINMGPEYGCINLSGVFLAVGMAAIVMLFLGIILRLLGKKEEVLKNE